MDAVFFLLTLIGSFFLGAVPAAYLAGKWLKGVDIRTQGSGNVGAANAFRVLGKGPGCLVLGFDFLKGFGPVWIIRNTSEAAFAIGLACILGHIFTPFLRFKGGKGIATGAGVLAGLFPILFAAGLGAWILSFAWTRIVSLSSLIAAAVIAILSWIYPYPLFSRIFLSLLFLLAVWTHRSNIARLRSKDEGPFS